MDAVEACVLEWAGLTAFTSLFRQLSEAEAERDAATFAKESFERQASRPGGGGGGGGSKQLQRELEETTKRLKAVEAELDLARQEARRLREQQARSYAANGCKMDAAEKAEYEEAMERVNVRLQTLEEVRQLHPSSSFSCTDELSGTGEHPACR